MMLADLITYTSDTTAEPPRSYEAICEESRTYVDVGDVAAWKIGDNAIEALTAGGTLTDYAKDIRKPKGTVCEFHKMSLYWDTAARAELFDTCPGITRSHMRKVLSIKDQALGRSFVEHAAERGWTVDQFGLILKRYKRIKGIGRKTKAAPRQQSATFEATFDDRDAWLTVELKQEDQERLAEITRAHPTARVKVVVEWDGSETT